MASDGLFLPAFTVLKENTETAIRTKSNFKRKLLNEKYINLISYMHIALFKKK